jgi:hypothetical protein
MARVTMMSELIRFVLRGALGGVIVPLLLQAYWLYRTPYYRLFTIAFLILDLIPAAIGIVTGAMLWLLTRKTSLRTGLITRALIGVGSATPLVAFYLYFFEYPRSPYTSHSFKQLLIDSIYGGLVCGALSGILARAGKKKLKARHEKPLPGFQIS